MKDTVKWCGSSADGVMGRVIGMDHANKWCGSCGNGVTGCGQIEEGYRQRVCFLGQRNSDEGYQQRLWFLWGWG